MKTKTNRNRKSRPIETGHDAPLLLRPRETAKILGISRATLWRRLAKGIIPAPVRLSVRCVRWRTSDISAYVASGCIPLDSVRVTG